MWVMASPDRLGYANGPRPSVRSRDDPQMRRSLHLTLDWLMKTANMRSMAFNDFPREITL